MLGFPQESLLLIAGKQGFSRGANHRLNRLIVLLFMFCHLFGVLGARLFLRWNVWILSAYLDPFFLGHLWLVIPCFGRIGG